MDIEDAKGKLDNPIWRLNNLYSIKDEDTGRVIPFKPRKEQAHIFDLIHRQNVKRIVIPKARRLGMSTGIDVALADQALWSPGFQGSIIDQTMADASKKMHDIIYTAFDSMPETIRDAYEVDRRNDSVFKISLDGDAPSGIYAGLNARGGNNNFLHVSEWGPIQFSDARRSEEIMTGAVPSARSGHIVVETTWKGGKGGHLWNIVKNALDKPPEYKTAEDWHLVFFGWHLDPKYSLEGNAEQIDQATNDYLDQKEQELAKKLTPGQRLWYYIKSQEQGLFMFSEFPTTVDECWMAPVEGAIYQSLIEKIRADGRISDFPWERGEPVHTFWDIGAPENTAVWYVQFVGREIHLIDFDEGHYETITDRVARMRAKGYPLGYAYLPHDGASDLRTGTTFRDELSAAGLKDIKIVPRYKGGDIWVPINRMMQLIPRMRFRTPQCETGVEALCNYHRERNEKRNLLKSEPVHDWSSHCADAFRQIGQAEMEGMLEGRGQVAQSSRVNNWGRAPKVIARVGF